MNLEKATYLNTLQTLEAYERKGQVVSAFGTGRPYAGIRFVMRTSGVVRLIADYRSLNDRATLLLDGSPIVRTVRPYSEVELRLERGEHLFEAMGSTADGGVKLTVEGVGITRSGLYQDRVGGYTSASECVVYLKHGNGGVERCVYDESSVAYTALTERYYDEATKYDASQSAYTATRRSCYATASNFTVNNGSATSFAYTGIRSLAMCDNRTLEAGADYLVAFVDSGCGLRFLRVTDGGVFASGDFSERIADARRVVSAQRGSVFLVEGKDRFWTAYRFHAEGEQALSFTGNTQHYDEIAIGKTGGVCPTVTTDETGAPILYYRKEDGRLMRLAGEDAPAQVAYAEAYHPASTGGLLQFAGELTPYSL